MKAAGFEITAVCSRPGSRTPYTFASRHEIPHVFDSPAALLEARTLWDALLIAVPPEATLPLLQRAVPLGVPILVEKPGARAAVGLKPFLGKQLPVLVGYNRRFYPPVEKLRALIAESRGAFLGHLMISESVGDEQGGDPSQAFSRRVISNTVHALDLLRFLLGSLKIESARPVMGAQGRLTGISALLRAVDSGSLINVAATWNAPANLSLTLVRPELRAVLEPFEELRVYRSMQRIEPTPEMPLRRYLPQQDVQVTLDKVDFTYKPGFYRQAQALRTVALGGEATDAATLDDAYHALALAEGILSCLRPAR